MSPSPYRGRLLDPWIPPRTSIFTPGFDPAAPDPRLLYGDRGMIPGPPAEPLPAPEPAPPATGLAGRVARGIGDAWQKWSSAQAGPYADYLSPEQRSRVGWESVGGMGRGLLEASGSSLLPVTTAQAFGSGLGMMDAARRQAVSEMMSERAYRTELQRRQQAEGLDPADPNYRARLAGMAAGAGKYDAAAKLGAPRYQPRPYRTITPENQAGIGHIDPETGAGVVDYTVPRYKAKAAGETGLKAPTRTDLAKSAATKAARARLIRMAPEERMRLLKGYGEPSALNQPQFMKDAMRFLPGEESQEDYDAWIQSLEAAVAPRPPKPRQSWSEWWRGSNQPKAQGLDPEVQKLLDAAGIER